MMLNKDLLNITRNIIKYYPIMMQFIILVNIFDYYTGCSFSRILYPVIGHSIAFDVLLLFLSKSFRFCAWHRLLIYNLIANIIAEWICVNIDVSLYMNRIMISLSIISGLFVIAAIASRFIFCKIKYEDKNGDKFENKD